MHLRVIEGGGRRRPWSSPRYEDMRMHLSKPSRRTIEVGQHQVEVLRGRFGPVDGEPGCAVHWRHVICKVRDQIGREFGLLRFVELQPEPLCLNVQLWEALDSYSREDSDLGLALISHWRWIGTDVSDYGNIIELREAGMVRPADPALLNVLIDGLWPRHSLFVVQAVPLNARDFRRDYTTAEAVRRDLREQALIRVCERTLGMRKFDGPPGEDRWMYRIHPRLVGVVEPPKYSPSLFDMDDEP